MFGVLGLGLRVIDSNVEQDLLSLLVGPVNDHYSLAMLRSRPVPTAWAIVPLK